MGDGIWHRRGRAASVALACALVIAIASACGGGSSEGDASAADATTAIPKRTTGPTVAVLEPVGDSEASGRALYSKRPDGSPMIRMRIEGLEPASPPARYIVWQKHSRDDMVLLAAWPVDEDGLLSKVWEPSIASLGYLEAGLRTKLLITRINDLSRMFSGSENSYVHNVIGQPVLEGEFEGALVGTPEGE